jgi:hypothetical protein
LEVDKEFIRSLLLVRPSKNLQRLFQILEGIPEQTACSAGPLPGRTRTPAEKAYSEEPRGPKPLRPSNVSGREKKDKKKKKDKQECTFTETELRRVVCEAIRAELGVEQSTSSGTHPSAGPAESAHLASRNQAAYISDRVPPPPYPMPSHGKHSVEMPRDIPAAKAKPRAAPKTASLPRRTSILPAFTRLRRAELEVLAVKWGVDPMGLNMSQIHDRLFEVDRIWTENSGGSSRR